MSELLTFNNVCKSYGNKKVLEELSFSVGSGRIVGLLGPNGSGKTTIIKLICALLHQNSGEIEVDGKAPGTYTKSIISYLPERTYLNDWMTVEKLVAFFADFYTDFDTDRAEKMLADLSIDKKSKLKALSKGTKEKVQLILVMSRKVKLYILDEPIGGVDPAARDYILKTILNNYDSDATILISTHLISDIEQIFDDVMFLSSGKITLSGCVDDIRAEYNQSIDQLFREVFKC